MNFECDICKIEFMNIENLNQHKRIHSIQKIYFECHICALKFYRLQDLKQHNLIHSLMDRIILKCNICNAVFQHEVQLNQHKQIHLDPDNTTKVKRQKILFKKKDEPKICNICDLEFDLSEDLQQHKLTHLDETPYKCDHCDESFTFIGQLKDHKKKSHLIGVKCNDLIIINGQQRFNFNIPKPKLINKKPSELRCEICKLVFLQINSYNAHIRIHSDIIECDICQSKFYRSEDLDQHKLIHINDPPFYCFICRKSLNNNESFHLHKLRHFLVDKSKFVDKSIEHNNIHICDMCPEWFGSDLALIRHKKSHKIFKCTICDDRFTQIEQLKDHKLSHYGENEYNCKICKLTFSRFVLWKRHNCMPVEQFDPFEVEIKQEMPLDIYDEID